MNTASKTIPTSDSTVATHQITRGVTVLRWSILLDLLWIGEIAIPRASDTISTDLVAVLITATLFSLSLILAPAAIWRGRIERLRTSLASRYGAVVLGLFGCGVALELLGYLGAIFNISAQLRFGLAALVGVVAAVSKDSLLAPYTAGGSNPAISPLLVATGLVRLAALSTILLPIGYLRWLFWAACVLNLPHTPHPCSALKIERV